MTLPKIRILALFLTMVALVPVVAFSTACPSQNALRKSIDASYRLPGVTNDLVDAVRKGRDQGMFTADQAKAFGAKIEIVAKAEITYVAMVKAAKVQFDKTGTVDPTSRSNLATFFDASVVGPFLDVLAAAKLVSTDQAAIIETALTAVRILLRTIGSGIGSKIFNALAGPGIIQTGRDRTAGILGAQFEYV